jgi:hypothetical protein
MHDIIVDLKIRHFFVYNPVLSTSGLSGTNNMLWGRSPECIHLKVLSIILRPGTLNLVSHHKSHLPVVMTKCNPPSQVDSHSFWMRREA